MPLQLVRDGQTGFASVTGLTPDGGSMGLGQGNLGIQIGPHFVGMDTSYNSMVKFAAAYDPSLDESAAASLRRCSFAGYVQFGQLRFLGRPVPPSLFIGPLASYAPYAVESGRDDACEFVDFMGPAQVATYLRKPGDVAPLIDPFFAINSVLSEQVANISDLFTFPHKNGSLLDSTLTGQGNQALGATLQGSFTVAQIDEAQIEEMLTDHPPLAEKSVTAEQVATSVVALLGLQALAEQPDLAEDERNIGPEDITMGRQIGRYSLLSVENFENEEPVLCIWIDEGKVKVSLLPWEDIQQRERQSTNQFLARIATFFAEQNVVLPGTRVASPKRGRGTGGGLSSNAFPWLDGPCLELRLRTVAFGKLLRQTRRDPFSILPLSGIEWSLVWNLDSDTRQLTLGDLKAPRMIPFPGVLGQKGGALAAYYAAVADPDLRDATVDVTNFGQAELDTQDFGGRGRKRRFIELDGSSQ